MRKLKLIIIINEFMDIKRKEEYTLKLLKNYY